MNKQLLGIIGIVVIVLIGGVVVMNQQQSSSTRTSEPTPAVIENKDAMMETSDDTMMKTGRYVTYSTAAYDEAKESKRVLFFHATWCPTCKSAHAEFNDRASEIPSGIVLLKTDYDQEKELKTKYGITYQHTFVQVDAEGNELAKWNGGGIEELKANIQ